MKAITLWQPYANDIVTGVKTTENRPWRTSYRGLLLIHAGASYVTGSGTLPRSAIVGIAELVDVHETAMTAMQIEGQPLSGVCCRVSTGALSLAQYNAIEHIQHPAKRLFHFVLINARRFDEPITADGRQMLWRPADDLLQKVSEVLVKGSLTEAAAAN